jgi:hypothetical protein
MSDIENIDPFADASSNTENDDSEEGLKQEFEAEELVETRPARPTVTINYQHEPGVNTHYCCQIDRDIHAQGTVILITNAQKTTDNSGSSYITYSIRVGVCNHSPCLRKSGWFKENFIINTFLGSIGTRG